MPFVFEMATRLSIRPRPLDVSKPLNIVKDVNELDSTEGLGEGDAPIAPEHVAVRFRDLSYSRGVAAIKGETHAYNACDHGYFSYMLRYILTTWMHTSNLQFQMVKLKTQLLS